MKKPTIRELMDSTGISQSYASMILAGERKPATALAVRIYNETGWKANNIEMLSKGEIKTLAKMEGV